VAIEDTYRELYINDYLQNSLEQGETFSVETIEADIEALLEDLDLSVPQFDAETYHVDAGEEATATKHRTTFSLIKQDLRALYKETLRLTSVSRNEFERWKLESAEIEKKLVDLEDRIENLLLLAQDTEGYHSVISDNFTDTFNVDLDETTASVDLNAALVEIGPTAGTYSKLSLETLEAKDITFKVRETANFISRIDSVNSDLLNIFRQDSRTWWTNISMRKPGPVTCELTVKLSSTAIELSKIFVDLHDSAESSPTTVTPLYSVDNVTYTQLPSNTFSIKGKGALQFSFSTVDAKWVKFILIKEGPDSSNRDNVFSYQFGFKGISFAAQGFTIVEPGDTPQTLVSWPRYQLGTDGLAQQFEKFTLEVCERLEEETDIKYYVTCSNDPDVPITGTTKWIPVSPINRTTHEHPQLITVGDTTENTYEDVEISYDGNASDSDLINPAESFHLLSSTGAGVIDETVTVVSSPSALVRYRFSNSGDRILNYQIKLEDTGSGTGDGVEVNQNKFFLFRNVGEQGLDPTDAGDLVRGVQRGWAFSDPWYTCVIQILNPAGLVINVGDQPIYIDGTKYVHKIDGTVLTGKTYTTTGIHTIQVHKNNWAHVTTGANDLATLKDYDPLYPYNHKLLIEGYSHGTSFPTSDMLYLGADIFAELLMKKVSIFDMIRNVTADNYKMFALDTDIPGTHTGGNAPTQVIVVKTNEESPDFQNERFVLKFTEINQLQRYLRFRADFYTSDTTITPALYGYKIKLG